MRCLQEGVHSLWRGLDSALLMSIPTVLMYYPLYDIMLDKLRNGRNAVNTSAMYHVSPMISGVVARATTALVVAPFEYVRTRQQAGSLLSAHAGGQSTWQTLRASLLKGGSAEVQLSGSAVLRALPTLWTGLAPTIARDVPFSAIYW
jgi:solute carrier family 25, member 39/40